eukprot:15438699-Alexandrium_andersonii.AAC.1
MHSKSANSGDPEVSAPRGRAAALRAAPLAPRAAKKGRRRSPIASSGQRRVFLQACCGPQP